MGAGAKSWLGRTAAAVFSVLCLAVSAPAAAAGIDGGAERCPQLAGSANLGLPLEQVRGASPVIYKSADGIDLRLHLFKPFGASQSRRLPVVVFFFGGGWMNGSADQFALQAQHVAARGAVAILADYRTYCRTGARVGDQVGDAVDAMRWIRLHAAELGIDPTRIAVVGGSAGGHLALSTAMFGAADAEDRRSIPDLLLLFYPCVDLTNEVEQEYSAKALEGFGRDLSPLYHVAGRLPPTYLFQGTDDPLYADTRSYCDQARLAGNRCDWREYAGAAHGFFSAVAPRRSAYFAEGLRALDETLTREGWLAR